MNIDLIPELLSEYGITPGRTQNLASWPHSWRGSAPNFESVQIQSDQIQLSSTAFISVPLHFSTLFLISCIFTITSLHYNYSILLLLTLHISSSIFLHLLTFSLFILHNPCVKYYVISFNNKSRCRGLGKILHGLNNFMCLYLVISSATFSMFCVYAECYKSW